VPRGQGIEAKAGPLQGQGCNISSQGLGQSLGTRSLVHCIQQAPLLCTPQSHHT